VDPESKLLTKAIQRALEHSKAVRCIIEDYIEGDQLHGDGYLQDGKLIYHYFGDHVFYTKTNNRIPLSTRWPTKHGETIIADVVAQVEAIAEASGYTNGPVNIEARVTSDGEVYIIEVSPRNGGNYVPIIQEHLTGFNFVRKVLDNALGLREEVSLPSMTRKVGAHYILHAEREGYYVDLVLSEEIKNKIFFLNVFKHKGDSISEYVGSNTTIGVVLLEFESIEERNRMMEKAQDHMRIVIG
jgi:biotin carboxylase